MTMSIVPVSSTPSDQAVALDAAITASAAHLNQAFTQAGVASVLLARHLQMAQQQNLHCAFGYPIGGFFTYCAERHQIKRHWAIKLIGAAKAFSDTELHKVVTEFGLNRTFLLGQLRTLDDTVYQELVSPHLAPAPDAPPPAALTKAAINEEIATLEAEITAAHTALQQMTAERDQKASLAQRFHGQVTTFLGESSQLHEEINTLRTENSVLRRAQAARPTPAAAPAAAPASVAQIVPAQSPPLPSAVLDQLTTTLVQTYKRGQRIDEPTRAHLERLVVELCCAHPILLSPVLRNLATTPGLRDAVDALLRQIQTLK